MAQEKLRARRRLRPGAARAIAAFVAFSVLAGILITAAVTPAVAVTSQAAKAGISVFTDLPDYLEIGTESQQNVIYAIRAGKNVPIATIYNQNRESVGWNRVSKYLKDAAVDGEDRRFYSHGGVDVESVVRATIGNLTSGSIQSGSSTLDMQLVKNILVQQALDIKNDAKRKAAYNDAINDTVSRKLTEMKLAIGLDKQYTKKQILLAYLNITGFGGNTYGVQAGAERYFSTDADNLTIAQAASLIAIVQQPNLQNLSDPALYPANKVRRDQILNDMYDLKDITKAEFDAAIATPIAAEVKLSDPASGCLYASDAQFACDYVNQLMPTLTALGSTEKQRAAAWANGGYKVYTSIDLDQQDAAQTALEKSAPPTETRFSLGAVADAVEPGTGKILVMAQNKLYDNSGTGNPVSTTAINLSTDSKYGGSSGFQTGSTYKIFTLTDWLQNGHGLNETVNGTVRPFQESSFPVSCASTPFGGVYTPKNDSAGEGGSMSVLSATERSVNAAFVGMAQKLDLCDIRDDATALGVHRADGDPLYYGPTSVLGVNEIAPLTMATAIAAIAANGVYCSPTIIDSVVSPEGKTLAGQDAGCAQSTVTPDIAATVAYALAGVMKAGTGSPGNPNDGTPIIGKTGTTDGSYQNWLIGSTTKVALAVWVGNIEGNPAKITSTNTSGDQSLRQITVAGTNGYNTKFNIFKTIMKSVDKNAAYKGGAFPTPDAALLRGTGVTVPSLVGQSSTEATSLLEGLGFDVVNGGAVASGLPVGQVVRSNPVAQTTATKGSTITIYTSDASLATAMPNVVGQTRKAAVDALVAAGFSSSDISYTWVSGSPADICSVTASTPTAGATTGEDQDVTLTVRNGGVVDGVDPGALCP